MKYTTLTERERAIIQHGHFFGPYKQELKGLFGALGENNKWSDDPRDMLAYLREYWIGHDHGNESRKGQYTEEECAKARTYLEQMGLMDAHMPVSGSHFDQAIIVGGTMPANYQRVALFEKMLELGIMVDKLVFWLGRRPRGQRDGTNEELLNTRGRFAGESIVHNPWIKDLVKRGVFKPRSKEQLTETDLGRFVILKLMGGKLMPYRVDLSVLNAKGRPKNLLEQVEKRPEAYVTDYYFKTNEGLEVILLNGAPVDRGTHPAGARRPKRHTTTSCTREWLDRHAPPYNATVLYITGNPHSFRTLHDTYAVLKEYGRLDIQMSLVGTRPRDNMPIQTYLGEVARLIDNDVRLNY